MRTTTFPRKMVLALVSAAQKSPGQEVCGLVSRANCGEHHHYAIANVAHHPERFFAMDPTELIAAFKSMRQRGEILTALYHSHPNGYAEPSATDIAEHAYPEALCLILAHGGNGTPILKAFDLSLHDQIQAVHLILQ